MMSRRSLVVVLGAAISAWLAGCATPRSGAAAAADDQTLPPPDKPGISVAALDRSADPCRDFYQFACGGWQKTHEIPPDKARWGNFDELAENNLTKLNTICQAAAAGKFAPEDRFGRKVGDFYAACMDEQGIEKTGLGDLQAEWARLESVTDTASLTAAVARLHADDVDALFGLGAMPDFKNSGQVIAWVVQGGLTLPDRDYYLKDDKKSAEIRGKYRAYLARMLQLAGLPAEQAGGQARAVFELERALAESHWTRTEARDPRRVYNPTDQAGLAKQCPRFDWSKYLQVLGIAGAEKFSVSTPKNLVRIDELLAKTPADTWRAYLRWRVLDEMAAARALPAAFVRERFNFVASNFTGAKEMEARWKHCTKLTDHLLGEALGQHFVRRYFPGDSKQRVLELIGNIQRAMQANLEVLAWMDEVTRKAALGKLGKIENKIGYPDKWRDYSAVAIERTSFLKSLLAATRFETRRQLDKIGKPVDRGEWHMTPPTVNAYYNPLQNEMVFPAGILQPVFYTRGANDAVNYGAIGFVMGHELTHGFDDQGRRFDADGNMTDWWSPAVGKEFEKRTACVEKQFSNYVAVDDLKLNGKLTLGENIADLGGLKLAFAAYQRSRRGRPAESQVAGFTPEQQFFLAAAQVWCSKMRPEEARRRVVVDPHSPPRWRVNGPLSNLPEFARAFGCQADAPMVRKERCQVW